MTKNQRLFLLFVFALLTLAARFYPHPWNWTPMMALSLIVTFLAPNRLVALATPVFVMLISDFALGFHGLSLLIYTLYALAAFFAYQNREHLKSGFSVVLSALVFSLIFYFVTNSAVWLQGELYPSSFSGLMASLAAGLPFLKNQILGDVVYTALYFYLTRYALSYSERSAAVKSQS